MHPILFYKERLGLYLSVWLIIAGLLAGLVAVSGTFTWGESFVLSVPMALVYAFMCLASFYLCRAFPLRGAAFLQLLGVYSIAAFLSSSLWMMFGRAWVALLSRLVLLPTLDGPNENVAHLFFWSGILLFLLAVVVHYLMIAFEASRAAERQALEHKVLAREAELKALKAQIHPHFLFNSLNSISALTTADPAAARTMSLRLSEFLRKTLKLSTLQQISLGDELSLVEDFLAVERIRFGSRLRFTKDVDLEAGECLVPSLLLQPLIENAVNHGIAHLVEGGMIKLEARRQGSRLSILVENPYDPEHVSGRSNGVGLENVRRRLATLYGSEARIVTQRNSGIFKVDISLQASTNPATTSSEVEEKRSTKSG
jgi:hypothetical protein